MSFILNSLDRSIKKLKLFKLSNLITKCFITSVLILASVIPSYSAVNNVPFNSTEIASHKVKDLSFKSIMREFYEGKMGSLFLNDDKFLDGKQYVGYLDKDGEMTNGIAFMYPTIEYINSNNEKRYLVIIQKARVDEASDGNDLYFDCHACQGTVDLYLFKKGSDSYELVSRNNPLKNLKDKKLAGDKDQIESVEFGSDYGQIGFNPNDLKKNIINLGQNLTGSLVFDDLAYTGTSFRVLKAIHLNENDYLSIYVVTDIESENNNEPEGSPLGYKFKGEYKVINNGSEYFPIEIKFNGDMPSKDYKKIIDAQRTEIYKFNPLKKKYEN